MSQGDSGSRGDMPQRLGAQEEFLLRAKEKVIEPATTMAEARKPNSLYQGTIVRVVLERSINTDSPGAVRGRVMSDVLDSLNQQTLLIPRGSTLIGSYKSSMLVGQARVLIAAERIILPNGKSVNLLGTPVADMQGASGLPADVDNHFWEMFRTSFIVGAASLLLPKDQQNISISEGTQGNTKTGGSILGTALYDTIKQISERNKGIGPTGTVDLGEPFTLMLSRDIEMEPYRKAR
ncbi:TrbI/VirB10 family protein (plasmid) [Polaromonas sp. P1-6]|nr:TrbI/VirB10 family protein [Polaromonas sp. P1-6]